MRRRDFLKGLAAVVGCGPIVVVDRLKELPSGLLPLAAAFPIPANYQWFSYPRNYEAKFVGLLAPHIYGSAAT